MDLGGVLQTGNLIIEVALGVLAVRGINTQQNQEERIRIFEIMQERGMLPTTHQVMSLPEHVQEQLAVEIEERIEIAIQEAERLAARRALPAPRKQRRVQAPQRAVHTATVKNATQDYEPDNESYIEEVGPTITRRSNNPQRRLSREY